MSDHRHSHMAHRRRPARFAGSVLSLFACVYGGIDLTRVLIQPGPAPLGRLGWLLSVGLPWQAWSALCDLAEIAAIVGLAMAAVGLFLGSARALSVGIKAQVPLFTLRALQIPAHAALIGRPAEIGLAMFGPESLPTEAWGITRMVSAAAVVWTVLYAVYLLWLRRELRKLRA